MVQHWSFYCLPIKITFDLLYRCHFDSFHNFALSFIRYVRNAKMKNVFVGFFPSIQSNEFEYLNVILLIDLLFRFGNRNPGRIDRYCMYIYVLLFVLVEHSENYSCGFSVSQLSTYNTYCVDATPHVLGSSLIRGPL